MDLLQIATEFAKLGPAGLLLIAVVLLWRKLEKWETDRKADELRYVALLDRYHVTLTELVKTMTQIQDELEKAAAK